MRYLIAGIPGVLAHYAILHVLHAYVGVWYMTSTTLGYIIGHVINFYLQKSWTFRNEELSPLSRKGVWYFIQAALVLIFNLYFLWLIVESTGFNPVITQAAVAVLVGGLSYGVTWVILTPTTN